MRGINERFINDLTTGCLSWFLQQVKKRDTFALEIRQDYINIYYRGGSALRITQKRSGYRFEFDEKYCIDEKGCPAKEKRAQIKTYKSLEDYLDNFDFFLSEMDNWFCKHPKAEREMQHNLIKLNTSDFCILDIEYAGSYTSGDKRRRFRFDMIAVSNGKLVIVENKNGEAAMGGKSGIATHYNDICAIIDNDESRAVLTGSIVNISENKKALGLPSADITGEEIELLFVVFNPNDRSKMLENERKKIHRKHPAKIIYMNAADKIQYDKAQVLI